MISFIYLLNRLEEKGKFSLNLETVVRDGKVILVDKAPYYIKGNMRVILLLLAFVFGQLHAATMSTDPKKYQVCATAIFKNEAPYLKEWIEYNRLIGVEHFYLYNNESDDHYLTVLAPYIKSGIVTLTDWVNGPEYNVTYAWVLATQMPAYEHAIKTFGHETKWLAVIDVDEFILPITSYKINDLLDKYEAYPGLLIYWQLYGTSNLPMLPQDKLMIESLTKTTHHEYRSDHYKSIIKPDLFEAFYWYVHSFRFKSGQYGIVIDLSEARINHYINRAEDYLFNNKIKNKERMDNRKLNEDDIAKQRALGNDVEDNEKLIFRYVPALRDIFGI